VKAPSTLSPLKGLSLAERHIEQIALSNSWRVVVVVLGAGCRCRNQLRVSCEARHRFPVIPTNVVALMPLQ
jgi:hypothetical protein